MRKVNSANRLYLWSPAPASVHPDYDKISGAIKGGSGLSKCRSCGGPQNGGEDGVWTPNVSAANWT
jgi:hypothetical protein